MNNREDEQLVDDLEVRITPLEQQDTSIAPSWLALTRHFQPRQRTIALQVALVLGLVLLTTLILPGTFLFQKTMMTEMVSRQMPTPTFFPGEDSFYIDVNLPWTRVFIDSHPIHIPTINFAAPLQLKRGHHLVTWLADPFQAQTCQISVPRNISDTCPLSPDDFDQQLQQPPAQILQLHNSLSALRTDSRTALINAVQQALAEYPATQLVQPGEVYIGPNGLVTAAQPLQASLHFQFDPHQTPDQPYLIAGEQCQQLCIVPWQYLPSQKRAFTDTHAWLALAFIAPSWSYATQSGRVLAHDQPLDLGGAGMGTYPILLYITWNSSSWHVEPLIGQDQVPPIIVYSGGPHDPSSPADKVLLNVNPSCVAARDLLGGNTFNVPVRFISGPNPASGCLGIVANSASNPSFQPVAYFLEHFGVLLAVNDAAHKLQPYDPRADAYERGLAEQLALLAGQTIT